MLERLKQSLLSTTLSLTLHRIEGLNEEAKAAQDNFMAKLIVPRRKTKNPVVIALVGLVGSGKSTIARELAPLIGAAVVEGDEIRVELRKKRQDYDKARLIGENAALEIIKRGGNVIMDSDFVDSKKAASLLAKAKKVEAKVIFIRVQADYDVMVGRVITAKYSKKDFFGGASSKLDGDEQTNGAIVKLREMWRRTPQHYRWVNEGGGRWELKNLPHKFWCTIDTKNKSEWQHLVTYLATEITALF